MKQTSIMAERNWTQFLQKVKINAPLQKVYDAWASQKAMERWFLRLAQFSTADGKARDPDEKITKGDTYLWRWHGYPDEYQETGKVLEANGKDRLGFTFGKSGDFTVSLREKDGITLMEIYQYNIPTDEESKFECYVGCQTGWTFYRANIKSMLEGGIDLRNKSGSFDLID